MHKYVLGSGVEHLGHLPLGQPNRLPVETHVDPHLALNALVDRDLATGAGFRHFVDHLVGHPISNLIAARCEACANLYRILT